MIDERIASLLREAIDAARAAGELPAGELPAFVVDRPKAREHGDWYTNVALALQRAAGRPPREVAQTIVRYLPRPSWVRGVEVAGPGFINFTLADAWLHEVAQRALELGPRFGATGEGGGASVNVEFVSINPTGPLLVSHGRHAAVGDAIARLLEHAGYRVTREYYFNDAGAQMDRFGESVAARYLELVGRPVPFPDDGYHGDYVYELARQVLAEDGDVHAGLPFEHLAPLMRERAYPMVLRWIRDTLERAGVHFDVWFSERGLYESGRVAAVVARLKELGHAYEKEGAVWLASSGLGDARDRVLVKSTGEFTYLAGDLAYHLDKAERGFSRAIVLLGADHHGQVPSLRAGLRALGIDPDWLEVHIMQFVHVLRGGEPVPLSKRTGTVLGFDELLDEVGPDVARYTFLQASIDHDLTFDIEEVKRQSLENPVYYVQYGHARIASILRRAAAAGAPAPGPHVRWELLAHPSESELLRTIASFEDTVQTAARLRAPWKLAKYAEELARAFHRFYTDCRVLGQEAALTAARIALVGAARQVLALCLRLLGVSAPERMEWEDEPRD